MTGGTAGGEERENSFIESRGTVAEHWVLLHNLWSISFKSLFLKSLQKINNKSEIISLIDSLINHEFFIPLGT